jgi:pyruvate formate lyase activating enzyme
MGQDLSDEDVFKEIVRDESFYRNSGGGITLSGGDPLYQFEFSLQLLKRCKERSFHTVLDTTGHVPWESLKEVIPYMDLLLYDLKHMDPERHREWTGVENGLILQNAAELSRRGVPMVIRFPLIPDHNDSEENLKSLAFFVKDLKAVSRIEIVPYHRLGCAKYEALGRPYLLSPLLPPDKEVVLRVKAILETSGKTVCAA